jgi:hypothetical protein
VCVCVCVCVCVGSKDEGSRGFEHTCVMREDEESHMCVI